MADAGSSNIARGGLLPTSRPAGAPPSSRVPQHDAGPPVAASGPPTGGPPITIGGGPKTDAATAGGAPASATSTGAHTAAAYAHRKLPGGASVSRGTGADTSVTAASASVSASASASRVRLPTDGFKSTVGNPELGAKFGNGFTGAHTRTPGAEGVSAAAGSASSSEAAASARDGSGAGSEGPVEGGGTAGAGAAAGAAAAGAAAASVSDGMTDADCAAEAMLAAIVERLDGAGVRGVNARKLKEGKEAVAELGRRLRVPPGAPGAVVEEVRADVRSICERCDAGDWAAAVASHKALAGSWAWDDHKGWLKGLRYLLDVAAAQEPGRK